MDDTIPGLNVGRGDCGAADSHMAIADSHGKVDASGCFQLLKLGYFGRR